MSWQASHWARDQRTGSAAAKVVLMVLAEHASPTEGSCFLSAATIGERAELGRSAVLKHLAGLEAAGLIIRRRRFDAQGHRSSDQITLAVGGAAQGPQDKSRDDPKVHEANLGEIPRSISEVAKVHLEGHQGPPGGPEKGSEKGVEKERAAPKVFKRKVAIPDGFPDAEAIDRERAYLRAEGWNIDARLEAEKFRSRNVANGGQYVDWRAAFHNWMVRAIGYAPPSAKVAPITAKASGEKREDPWRNRVKAFADPSNLFWNATDWGPAPGKPGCVAPSGVLAEYGFGGAEIVPFERRGAV